MWTELLGPKQLAALLALACWLFSRQGLRHPGWLITVQLTGALVVEVWAKKLALNGEPNLWWYSLGAPLEYGALLLFAIMYMRDGLPRRLAWAGFVLYGLLYAYEQHLLADGSDYANRSAMLGAFLLAGAYTYLLFRLAEDETRALAQRPEFWLFLGVVVYYGGMIPLYGLLESLNAQDIGLSDQVFIINDVLYYVSIALLITSCLLFRRKGETLWTART